jgi:anti-sigma factor RsiW
MARIPGTSCDRAAAQISLRLDGELSSFEEAKLRAHLAGCPACRAYERDTATFTGLVRRSPLESFDLPIVMPRRQRLALRPLQVGAAAAMLAVVAAGGVFGLGRSGDLPHSLGVTGASQQAGVQRPAYLDSASYELRLIRQMRSTHAPGGSAVPL